MIPFFILFSSLFCSCLCSNTVYFFIIFEEGCVNLFVKNPSFVNIINPVVFLSSLPTGYIRLFLMFIKSNIVFLFFFIEACRNKIYRFI